MDYNYHSALKNDHPNEEDLCLFQHPLGIALKNDIMRGLPYSMGLCNLIYGEPPWERGLKVFDSRAGVSQESKFKPLMEKTAQIIKELQKPFVFCIGKQAKKLLPPPDLEGEVILNGGEALLCAWKPKAHSYTTFLAIEEAFSKKRSTKKVIEILVRGVDSIGDPFCGYGGVASEAIRQGKHFVVSDYNGKCVGFMARTLK